MRDWGPPVGLAVVMVLLLLMRFSALTWPLNQQPAARCYGHPDESNHYLVLRSFPRRARPINYPPGLGYMTYLVERAGLGRLAESLAPPGSSGNRLARIRGVYTARLLSLLFSCAGVWLLYALWAGRTVAVVGGLRRVVLGVLAPLLGLQHLRAG